MYEYRKLDPEQRAALVQERLQRGFPPHEPPHPARGNRLYLLTATCYQHACHMPTEQRRRQLLDALFRQCAIRVIQVRAWVVLPNHYHLVAEAPDFSVFSDVFRLVHGATSHRWNLEDGQPGRKVWYRFSDRAIRSERHYFTTLNYLHYNPVKHGWTGSPYAWAGSSVHEYLARCGRAWLQDLWRSSPVRDFGRGWDDVPGGNAGNPSDRGALENDPERV